MTVALGCVLLLAAAGCDSVVDPDVRPSETFSAEAFQMQTELFEEEASAAQSLEAAGEEFAHFTEAATRVGVVSTVVKVHLILPALATKAALQAEPVREGDSWIWSTTVEGDEEFTVTLTGTPSGEQVDWSMRVSSTGEELEDFELYTAETARDRESGSWELYYPIDGERRSVLAADFTIEGESKKQITFRKPESAENAAGDFVQYAVDDGAVRSFLWTQVEEDREHLVEWNAQTKAGALTATNYNDGERACWNADLENAACADLGF